MLLSAADAELRHRLHSELRNALEAIWAGDPPHALGVAVSGGSDSLALLHLLRDLTQAPLTVARTQLDHAGNRSAETNQWQHIELHVATVDHALRPESRSEAEYVAEQAASLGLSHDILTWTEPARSANLQDAARQARYGLLTKWAMQRGLSAIAVGHTADDQAETVLMRLRRAAGVTGLSGMARQSHRDGVGILRPLLGLRRDALRRDLKARGVAWLDDPSNSNRKFERIRMRDALKSLEPLGISVEQLAAVAENMQQAEDALAVQTEQAVGRLAQLSYGAVVIEMTGFLALPHEVRRRLLLAALAWRVGPGYPPRRAPVQAALAALEQGRGSALAGCRVLCRKGKIWVFRELQALQHAAATWPQAAGDSGSSSCLVWDHVWEITGPAHAEPMVQTTATHTVDTPEAGGELEIRPLGDQALRGEQGQALCAEWRALDLPREVLKVTPGLWRGAEFLGPLAHNCDPEWGCKMVPNELICDPDALSH